MALTELRAEEWMHEIANNDTGRDDFWRVRLVADANENVDHLCLPVEGGKIDGWVTLTPAKARELLRCCDNFIVRVRLNIR